MKEIFCSSISSDDFSPQDVPKQVHCRWQLCYRQCRLSFPDNEWTGWYPHIQFK